MSSSSLSSSSDLLLELKSIGVCCNGGCLGDFEGGGTEAAAGAAGGTTAADAGGGLVEDEAASGLLGPLLLPLPADEAAEAAANRSIKALCSAKMSTSGRRPAKSG